MRDGAEINLLARPGFIPPSGGIRIVLCAHVCALERRGWTGACNRRQNPARVQRNAICNSMVVLECNVLAKVTGPLTSKVRDHCWTQSITKFFHAKTQRSQRRL